jgi:osmoprotectant transport system substrate-binding protein
VQALNDLSAVLTTEKLMDLHVEFSEEKRNPLDIAEDFLRDNGLA